MTKAADQGVATPRARQTKIAKLIPHPRNYRSHPQEQIDHIRASLREHGFYRNVVATSDLTILAGHGVVMAAEQEGMTSVPVIVIDTKPDSAQALKILAGDNFVAQMSEDDDAALRDILADLKVSDDLLGTGFDEVPNPFGPDSDDDGAPGKTYTKSVVAPTYEPKAEVAPDTGELFDSTVTQNLVDAILAEDLPDDVQQFLILAANRHTKFRFDRIAEFYAHAAPAVQRLMEDSALVIVDFDSAIKNGFVRLTERVEGLFKQDYPDA